MRYKMNAKYESDNIVDTKIEDIWISAIKRNNKKIDDKYEYPIRKRIEFIFNNFVELFVDDYYESNEIWESIGLWQNLELWRNTELYLNSDKNDKRMRIMVDLLSFYRDNKPGTYGHLLWIFLYISELSYFKSDKKSQPKTYWEEFELNENNLNDLFNDFFAIQEENVQEVNAEMIMCCTVAKSFYFEYKAEYKNSFYLKYEAEYKRIKSILWRDKRLKEEFIYTNSHKTNKQKSKATGKKGKSNFGQRCFAILTDGTADNKYVSISGNNKALYKLCMSVFDSKLSQTGKNPEKYKFIEWDEYPKSLYVWVDGICIKKLSQTKIDNIINSENIIPPNSYNRMFSCAERRLVHKYKELESQNKDLIIISKKTPCYMCERVLEYKNIKYVSFETYTQTNANIQKELDFFADKIYSFKKNRNSYF